MDKNLLITGGSRGIGAATAILAASQGYPVGDVRAPLTQFADLGQEGIDRRARIVSILDDINGYVATQAK